jgi:thiosulfate/3-mercaptopyruvate sulfurtransferase
MSNLIQADELRRRLDDPELRVVDVRFDLADTGAGERAFGEGHIPGAVYAHLDRDLSGPLGRHGGRHPLPEPATLAATLGELGIGNSDEVVAYDSGNELTGEVVRPPGARVTPNPRPEMAVGRDHVLRNLGNPDVLLVDARAGERYRGEVEPIDPRAGHIPSAVNLPFAGNLENGRFRSQDELRRRFEGLEGTEEVVVYCGSGVSAAHDVLAMEEAGYRGVRLYHGSWSDWCSYDDAPVETGGG